MTDYPLYDIHLFSLQRLSKQTKNGKNVLLIGWERVSFIHISVLYFVLFCFLGKTLLYPTHPIRVRVMGRIRIRIRVRIRDRVEIRVRVRA